MQFSDSQRIMIYDLYHLTAVGVHLDAETGHRNTGTVEDGYPTSLKEQPSQPEVTSGVKPRLRFKNMSLAMTSAVSETLGMVNENGGQVQLYALPRPMSNEVPDAVTCGARWSRHVNLVLFTAQARFQTPIFTPNGVKICTDTGSPQICKMSKDDFYYFDPSNLDSYSDRQLQDYDMQMMMIEQWNEKRQMLAGQEQEKVKKEKRLTIVRQEEENIRRKNENNGYQNYQEADQKCSISFVVTIRRYVEHLSLYNAHTGKGHHPTQERT